MEMEEEKDCPKHSSSMVCQWSFCGWVLDFGFDLSIAIVGWTMVFWYHTILVAVTPSRPAYVLCIHI